MLLCHVMLCHRGRVIHAKLWKLPLQKLLPNFNRWTECDQNVQVKHVSSSKTTDDFVRISFWLLSSPVTANYINKGSNVYSANTLCLKPVIFCFQCMNPNFLCIMSITTKLTKQICYVPTELCGQLMKTITNLHTTTALHVWASATILLLEYLRHLRTKL